MFFIGIFGIESKSKEIKILENLQCKKCNLKTKGKLIKTFDCFHFFFIPLFKWNESYYVVCNRCNSVYEIPKEKGKEIHFHKEHPKHQKEQMNNLMRGND